MKNSGSSAWLPGNMPNHLSSKMLESLQRQTEPCFNHVAHREKHLLALSAPSAEWQYYLSPLDREISSLNVILIRCSSLQLDYEDSCTEVRRTWENLIKACHWESNMSLDVESKEDMTGTPLYNLVHCIDNYPFSGHFYFDCPVYLYYKNNHLKQLIGIMFTFKIWAWTDTHTYSNALLKCFVFNNLELPAPPGYWFHYSDSWNNMLMACMSLECLGLGEEWTGYSWYFLN